MKKLTLLIVILGLLFTLQNCNSDTNIEAEDSIKNLNSSKLHPDDDPGVDDGKFSGIVPLVYVLMEIIYPVNATASQKAVTRNIFVNDSDESWETVFPTLNTEHWIIRNDGPFARPCCSYIGTLDGSEPIDIIVGGVLVDVSVLAIYSTEQNQLANQ